MNFHNDDTIWLLLDTPLSAARPINPKHFSTISMPVWSLPKMHLNSCYSGCEIPTLQFKQVIHQTNVDSHWITDNQPPMNEQAFSGIIPTNEIQCKWGRLSTSMPCGHPCCRKIGPRGGGQEFTTTTTTMTVVRLIQVTLHSVARPKIKHRTDWVIFQLECFPLQKKKKTSSQARI